MAWWFKLSNLCQGADNPQSRKTGKPKLKLLDVIRFLVHAASRSEPYHFTVFCEDSGQVNAWIYMGLRNLSCLFPTSGHHWERDGSRQKPLDNWICWLSSSNQNAHHEHWSVFSAYKVGMAFVLCIPSCSQQWWFIDNVQCISDYLPVSVSTEPVYSDDCTARRSSNPYKIWNISG